MDSRLGFLLLLLFVNFELFCGKAVERPESRVEEVKDKRIRHDGAFKVGKEVS